MLVNTFLYSVYGSVNASRRRDPRLVAYRSRWLDALLVGTQVQAVLTLRTTANEAWQLWKAAPAGQASSVAHAAVAHPTQPESSSKGDKVELAVATKQLLHQVHLQLPRAPGSTRWKERAKLYGAVLAAALGQDLAGLDDQGGE